MQNLWHSNCEKRTSSGKIKTIYINKILIIGTFFSLAFAVDTYAATYYVCGNITSCNTDGSGWSGSPSDNNSGVSKSSPLLTIRAGIGKLVSGDTLVIGNGTYTGSGNYIDDLSSPHIPSGTAGSYTTVRADVDGGVTIDGSTYAKTINQWRGAITLSGNNAIDSSGFNPITSVYPEQYIALRGIVLSGSYLLITSGDHIKVINCGVVDAPDGNYANMVSEFNTYTLFEGCYAWGGGRYKFLFFHSHNGILRNCVGRNDYVHTPEVDPTATFSIYSSTNVEVQNSIDIDSDTRTWINVSQLMGSFIVPTTSATTYSGSVNFTNCMAVNSKQLFASSDKNAYSANANYTNCLGWHIRPTSPDGTAVTNGSGGVVNHGELFHNHGDIHAQQCTFGDVAEDDGITPPALGSTSSGWWNGWPGTNASVSQNNIYYNFSNSGNSMFYDVSSSYDVLSNVGSTPYVTYGTQPTNVNTTNPVFSGCIKYLPRLEAGCPLWTAGASGSRVGANIIYQYGKPGTLWGDAGYNLLQDGTNGQDTVNLWPFPNEGLIKRKMQAYSNHSINGARGFCGAGYGLYGGPITLTSYIWEYLGNPMPSFGKIPSPPVLLIK